MQIVPLSLDSASDVENSAQLPAIFTEKGNPFIVSKAIRWQAAKKRLGVRATKGISDIRATTRKPYRQKGTGRARQGSLVSPQFRGGAVIFGPVKRDHSFDMNKKERSLALRVVLSGRFQEKQVYTMEGSVDQISTKAFIADLEKLVSDWKHHKLLFIGDFNREFLLSTRSIFTVDVLSVAGLNVRDLVAHDMLIFRRKDLGGVVARLAK